MTRITMLTMWCLLSAAAAGAASPAADAESTVRALVRANADKDLGTMARLMAHDADITSYTSDGWTSNATCGPSSRRSSGSRSPFMS
jgi:hypothetical protein